MRIIFVNEKGASKSFRGFVLLSWGAVLGCMVAWVLFANHWLKPDWSVDGLQRMKDELSIQQAELSEIEKNANMRNFAVSAELAGMQSALWEIEAIANSLSAITELPQDEFNFDPAVSQGGSSQEPARKLDWPDLESQLRQLQLKLERRQKELRVLDDIVKEKKSEKDSVLRGKPVKKGWYSSAFGRRMDPITGRPAWHAGVDFAGKLGSDVIAVASGVVVYSGRKDGYGNLVEIDHGNGVTTRYGHHDELKVQVGDFVKQGDVIGLMGNSGRSTGPHVHLEVLRDGRAVNPLKTVEGMFSAG
ncbi:MAG: M23 family metallopeptidase [Pseudomonadota bacterium]|nr:M23 family metallopeptidase [Pseudomonadota bacterium]